MVEILASFLGFHPLNIFFLIQLIIVYIALALYVNEDLYIDLSIFWRLLLYKFPISRLGEWEICNEIQTMNCQNDDQPSEIY